MYINRQPTREDIVNIVSRMYEKDGISRKEVASIVDKFPNQGNIFTISMRNTKLQCEASLPSALFIAALDFYGALRSRTYDRSILKVTLKSEP